MTGASLQSQAHALGQSLSVGGQLTVKGQALLVTLELCLGQAGRVSATEQLQQTRISELIEVCVRTVSPAPQGLQAGWGEAVDAATTAPLLTLLIQKPGLGQSSAAVIALMMRSC